MKIILIVLDSVGIGAAPDAAEYGDAGAATLQHISEAVPGFKLPVLERLGLGNCAALAGLPIRNCPPAAHPQAAFGILQEVSEGKDTITGHWEIAGLEIRSGFYRFPQTLPAFPPDLIAEFERRTGRGTLANRHADGMAVIEEFGEKHLRTGRWIVYTSADSVFQIAAHTEIIPLEELYRACEMARALCDPLKIGRVIARPFTGKPGGFERTKDRRDYAYTPDEPLLTERLHQAGVPVYAVGKIEDIVARRGLTDSLHTGGNRDSQQAVESFFQRPGLAFIWANFIDFDMLHGHRRDPQGYFEALAQTDRWLETFLPRLGPDDLLLLTADHGNDPTFKGFDHTREWVPLLVYGPQLTPCSLGIRHGFFDIARTVTEQFGAAPPPRGKAFFKQKSEDRSQKSEDRKC